jgi:hypothetical protein
MGKGWEGIAASNGGNNPFGSCEAFAKTFSRRQEEDRGSRTRSLGEVQSGEEESPLEPLKPAASAKQFSEASRVNLIFDCRKKSPLLRALLTDSTASGDLAPVHWRIIGASLQHLRMHY